MQISATNILLKKIDLNCLRGSYQLNIIQLTLLLRERCCNYTFPLTETTLKFNYPEKTAWIGGTIGIIGDNSKVMNTTSSVLGLPQRPRWHTRMDWSFFLLVLTSDCFPIEVTYPYAKFWCSTPHRFRQNAILLGEHANFWGTLFHSRKLTETVYSSHTRYFSD